jgi:hypothetical protein
MQAAENRAEMVTAAFDPAMPESRPLSIGHRRGIEVLRRLS